MNEYTVTLMSDEELPEIMSLSEKFGHVDHFATIVQTAFVYVLKKDNKPIGLSSLLRSKRHWSFYIFNVDILEEYCDEDVYSFFVKQVLDYAYKENGYHVTAVVHSLDNKIYGKALEACGMIKESETSDYKVYNLFRPINSL